MRACDEGGHWSRVGADQTAETCRVAPPATAVVQGPCSPTEAPGIAPHQLGAVCLLVQPQQAL